MPEFDNSCTSREAQVVRCRNNSVVIEQLEEIFPLSGRDAVVCGWDREEVSVKRECDERGR